MQKIMSRLFVITLALSIVFIFGSVSQAKKELVLGVIQMTQDIPVQIAMSKGIEEKAKELGGIKINVFNGQFDVAKQMNAIENFIIQKVDAILIDPADADSIVNGVKAANKAGIPVITFDTNANGGDVTAFVESNNAFAGHLVGEYMAWRLKGKGKVAILDLPMAAAVRDRTGAWHKVMAKYPGIEVVQTEIAATVPDGMKCAENILQAHPDLDAFFCINDPGGLGAVQAIKSRGLQDKIFVAAIDGDPKAVELISKGEIYELTVAQFGAEIGRVAAQTAYDYLNGKKIEKHIMVPVMPVTKGNFKMYPGWAGKVPADLTPTWTKKQ
ncbi:MAG: sugar ABC transporter substrate-binding protein [Methanosarcinaceae archaeon]|nr:sugar ABC transporter substrate-binding protein [Methanosarcinaceae archaeon]